MKNILAEFIIFLSEKNNTVETFKKALIENGAEFSDSFISNLLRIIQHMRPKRNKDVGVTDVDTGEKDVLAQKFPGLALPNETQTPLINEANENKHNNEDTDIVADLMAQFEAEAPSANKELKSDEKMRKRERYNMSVILIIIINLL